MIGKDSPKLCCLCKKPLTYLIRNSVLAKRGLHVSHIKHRFAEFYRKGELRYEGKPLTIKEVWKEMRKNGLKLLKQEIKLFGKEVKEKFVGDIPIIRAGDSEIMWKFNSPEVLDKFIVGSDKDFNEGYSESKLELNRHNHAVFSGTLSSQLPKTGDIARTGYCSITSLRAMKSFQRETYWDWFPYTHLILRVRGDGRSYILNLGCEGYFDVTWHDMYHYPLYTRGGPYWQFVKIPFSKFYLSNRGRIQDKQSQIPLTQISRFGITLSDKVPGPFQLEIDYVGRLFDPSHTEEFAYEMYKAPDYTVGV